MSEAGGSIPSERPRRTTHFDTDEYKQNNRRPPRPPDEYKEMLDNKEETPPLPNAPEHPESSMSAAGRIDEGLSHNAVIERRLPQARFFPASERHRFRETGFDLRDLRRRSSRLQQPRRVLPPGGRWNSIYDALYIREVDEEEEKDVEREAEPTPPPTTPPAERLRRQRYQRNRVRRSARTPPAERIRRRFQRNRVRR
jgi:hypothetical protein